MDKATAKEQLSQVKSIQHRVSSKAAKDYLVFLGWGLYAAILIPVFDYTNQQALWGVVVMVAALLGTIGTWKYYSNRNNSVAVPERVSNKIWIALGVWSFLCSLLTINLMDRVDYAYTLGGLMLAAPTLAYGLWLWNKQR